MHKAAPLTHPLRALSIGSGDEPHFRILEAAFKGGLTLLDIDETALAAARRRIDRQMITGVEAVLGGYSLDQRLEITAFVLENFWRQKKPLIQVQDYLAIYKGMPAGGLV